MAINLSDLTGASTSANILAEVQSTADFLDSVPLLKNLADPSGATDAKQFTATNQPTALPLTKDSNGVLGGYLYQPDVTGNAPAVTFPTINANEDFVFEMEVYLVDATSFHLASGSSQNHRFAVHSNAFYFAPESAALDSPLATGASTLTVERSGTTATLKQDGVVKATLGANVADNIYDLTHLSHNGQFATSIGRINGYIKTATLSINGTEELNIDFTSPNVRHGATKFKCATGQVVTINQSGNNPATVIKKPVLRFDGVNSSLQGLFANNIDSGYMFAAFSVLGDGGDTYGRIFSVHNSASAVDSTNFGFIFSLRELETNNLGSFYNSTFNLKNDLFDDDNGDILHEVRSKSGQHLASVNGASLVADSRDTSSVDSDTFNISRSHAGASNDNVAIDLEYLALFPATITDEQADAVRNYINNRNNVFDLKDGFGYYFFDPQSLTTGAVTSWNGRIIGSDNGDADKLATQATAADQPTSDGYKVTFADATDHLDIPSTTQAGWQVVGTSLGTFVYKVNANAVTELNLLGNLGNATYRQAGDLYGIILLPENATNRDINEAKRLLIDRGASDGVSAQSLFSFWRGRGDIVEFGLVDTSSVTTFQSAWRNCSSLTSFPLLDTSSGTNFIQAWFGCSSLTSFPLLDTSSGTTFYQAWLGCSSLTSFPAIDVSSGVNFFQAWFGCSSLTSFPLLDTSSGTTFQSAWQNCSSLTSFPLLDTSSGTTFQSAWLNCSSLTSFPLLDTSSGTTFQNAWQNCSSLTSFPLLDTSSGTSFSYAWYNCFSLTSFPLLDTSSGTNFISAWAFCRTLTSFPLLDTSSGTNFGYAWYNCFSLKSFPANFFDSWSPASVSSGVFNGTWDGCTSLTAQSVENILTSIDASGKYATSTGASGGTALADAGIDIDYNGDPLTAATTAAITSLKSKGWSIFINSVEQ